MSIDNDDWIDVLDFYNTLFLFLWVINAYISLVKHAYLFLNVESTRTSYSSTHQPNFTHKNTYEYDTHSSLEILSIYSRQYLPQHHHHHVHYLTTPTNHFVYRTIQSDSTYRRRAAAPYTPLRYASLTYGLKLLGLATIGSANWKTYKLTF